MNTENEQLIDLITAQTRNLLETHWGDIDPCRDGDEDIKVAFIHKLSYEGTKRTVKTKISLAHRVTDEIEEEIDTAQVELPLEKGKRK
jgi:hypothetical protein